MRTLLVSIALLTVAFSPMLNSPSELEDSSLYSKTSPLQVTLSSTTGWTTGGEEVSITGSGFSDLAFRNTTYDGISHQWSKSTADYADQSGPENAIAIDSNGNIHIVYINGGNYKVMHTVYDGTFWSSEEIGDCEGSYCWDAHMVIDDNDELHVAYAAQSSLVVYQHYNGSDWNGEVVSNTARFAPVGIAVDSNNHPHISYSASGLHCGGGLRLASFDGTDWSSQSVDYGSNKGCDSSIVIDENDYVYIAYQDREDSKLKFATNKSGSWISYTPEASTWDNRMYPGYHTSLAMDEEGLFHIAHYESDNENLHYSTGLPNGQWSNSIVDSSGDTGRNPSISIDAAGDPHIVYRSWNGWKAKYATLNPSSPSWQVSTLETGSTGAGTGESNSIFIDDDGMMHVAYSDETNGVLRYANKSTGVSITREITVQFGQHGSMTGTVVNDTTILVTTPAAANPGLVSISLFDKDGQEHQLSPQFQYIDQNDLDSDGVLNANDDCPEVAGNSTEDLNGCPDNDGDGYSNSGDTFPNDANEWMDSDDDGVGDNGDAFPNDASETQDSDSDGVGDNIDAFPNDASETLDSDGDGVGDNADAFPFNSLEWEDLDGNQIPDNSEASKIEISSSSEDLRIHPYHIFADNLTLTIETITSEGFTLVYIQSEPGDILPDIEGMAYGMYGGDSLIITLRTAGLADAATGSGATQSFFTGDYIDDFGPWINFTVHVTGVPHGCEGLEEWWDEEQQVMCPSKVANHLTNYYANFSMMLWNGDDDGDGVPNSWDRFPLDANESKDSDGDGIGDNADAFPNDANESMDSDGDGIADGIDQCPDTEENASVDGNGCPQIIIDSDGDGIADIDDQCPEVNASSLDNDGDGCLDDADADGVIDSNDACPSTVSGQNVTNSGCSDAQLRLLDTDSDGVSDFDDQCPETPANSAVDTSGCTLETSSENEEASSMLASFLSGESDAVTTTVGIGAILLALFSLLQTNAAAAILPDAFRWMRVIGKNSKLSKEELNELTYLQSITQAYYGNPQELAEELQQLKGDLTARYTNNEIKKQTREKLFTLIDELMLSTPEQLNRIAHNDAYFGISGTIDSEDRTRLLNEKLAMTENSGAMPAPQVQQPAQSTNATLEPATSVIGMVKNDGYEWLEYPENSGIWYWRDQQTGQWVKHSSSA